MRALVAGRAVQRLGAAAALLVPGVRVHSSGQALDWQKSNACSRTTMHGYPNVVAFGGTGTHLDSAIGPLECPLERATSSASASRTCWSLTGSCMRGAGR